ncbi:Rv3235 family protein [Nocardia sp. NPDC059177]|uniref:Rv3235 family protein n=1 Tax=Nocardia sp. NPDC059177 TaxID=3346759 RepID=UPI0036757493
MSTDPLSLFSAPHCEPRLENQVAAARVAAANVCPAQRVTGSMRASAPRGISLAVRKACRQARPPEIEFATGAEQFADQVVRLLLEVVDRRRTAVQLSSVVDERVLSAVQTMIGQDLAPGRALGVATVTKVRLTSRSATGAEVFASYQRGPRTFALAGRIESGTRSWRLVAVRLY